MGRAETQRTDGIRDAVKEWTGDLPVTCPWDAFRDPFVVRVVRAWRFYSKSQLAAIEPEPSHRLVMGIEHYASADARCEVARYEMEKQERERGRAHA